MPRHRQLECRELCTRERNWKPERRTARKAARSATSSAVPMTWNGCAVPSPRCRRGPPGLPGRPGLRDQRDHQHGFRLGRRRNDRHELRLYLGLGHRFGIHGDEGDVTWSTPRRIRWRGFESRVARRPASALNPVEVDDPVDLRFPADGRIAPVSRLAADFLDAIVPAVRPFPALPKAFAFRSCSIPPAMPTSWAVG